MCGICGIFNFDAREVASSELLGGMIRTLGHRGPDGSGSFLSGNVGLGHTRLSIIDLEGGAQPLTNEDGSLQLIFNGEIYNFIELRHELKANGHQFRTQSDSEVIVHAYEEWGEDCVRRFNGIFAFAMWDARRERLFLARDHLGVKPLYYTRVDNRLLFASEIKALLSDPRVERRVDLPALSDLFTFRYVPSPKTLFTGVRKLPPGHSMVVHSGGTSKSRFWDWTPQVRTRYREKELLEEYQYLLQDAVRLQMRSDVPVGLFLSSGIDSGVLLALMSGHTSRPIKTFTIGFEDGERTNELTGARRLSERFGSEHYEQVLSPQDYISYYKRHLRDIEEPVGNETAAAFYFVSRLAGEHVKVALSGQGADEPWGGYHRYVGVKLSQYYSRLPSTVTQGIVRPLVEMLPRSERLKRGVNSLDEPDMLTRFARIYSFYSPSMKQELFQPWLQEVLAFDLDRSKESLRRLFNDVEDLDSLTQMLYIDTRASLPDDLLMVADKTGMANSLEARVPLLDHRIIEFIETLPPKLKLRGFTGKYLHKKAVEKWLPREEIYKKKKGFANPIDEWMRSHLVAFENDLLLAPDSGIREFFNPSYVRRMLDEHSAGREQYLRHLYLLISFELWHREFISAKAPVTV